jgi:dinuclear metal center YbgI/SA1388 family protein
MKAGRRPGSTSPFLHPGETPVRRLPRMNHSDAMALILADIFRVLERMAPPHLAEEWDPVGLQLGDPGREVESVWVALDPSPDVVSAACREGVGLLVTHHPLIFRPLQAIHTGTPLGAAIAKALRHGLAVYAMHTNLDAAAGGLNDWLAQRLGVQRLRPLVGRQNAATRSGTGIGRSGVLPERLRLGELALEIKGRLGLETVRVVGDASRHVKRVALSTGSGGSLLPQFLASAADVFITGDLRYHDAREIEAAQRGAIDIGHFHSEHLMTAAVAQRLRRELQRRRARIRVEACPIERDPFQTL